MVVLNCFVFIWRFTRIPPLNRLGLFCGRCSGGAGALAKNTAQRRIPLAPRLSICSFPLNVCATPQPELSDTLTGRTRRACLRQARLWAASPPTRVSAQPKRAACAAKRATLHPYSAFKQVGFISGNVKRRDCGDSAELVCVCKSFYPCSAFE